LHDSAQPGDVAATVNLLNSWDWELLQHPPYSPDLAPSAYHLNLKMKTHLRGQQCRFIEDIQNEVKKWLHAQDRLFFCEGLEKFIYCCDTCLNRLDDYVEK
jgi:hypothetical protein